VRGVLLGLDRLIRERPRQGTDEIRGGIERITAGAHALRELSLLAVARSEGLPLAAQDAADAQTIIGAEGTPTNVRLGVAEGTDDDALRDRVGALLVYWRRLGESPLTERATAGVCRVVIRSLEEIASELGPASDVMLPGGPGDGGREHAGEQREQHEPALGRE
jgi:hypothetical protein